MGFIEGENWCAGFGKRERKSVENGSFRDEGGHGLWSYAVHPPEVWLTTLHPYETATFHHGIDGFSLLTSSSGCFFLQLN